MPAFMHNIFEVIIIFEAQSIINEQNRKQNIVIRQAIIVLLIFVEAVCDGVCIGGGRVLILQAIEKLNCRGADKKKRMSRVNKISIKDISKQNKYKIEDVNVYTPYEIYESQHTFMSYVLRCLANGQNALVQSPTGTGKTLSLLCSTLAWVYEQQQKTGQPPPQIVYASRTHSQLKQVVSEIGKLCFQVKISILSSRDQSCANDDLKLLRGQDKELECRLRVAQRKGLSCSYYHNESYYQKQVELGKVMDLEEIGLKGRLEKFCPFFYERHSRPVANVVLVPYNYLFDRKVWASEEGVRLDGAVLILDEAHNIQGACEQFREYSINLSTLARAIQQADELRFQKLNQNKNKLDPGVLDKVRMMKVTTEDIQINAAYIQLIYEHLQTLDIPSGISGLLMPAPEFTQLLDNATQPSEFGTLTRNIKSLTAAFENFRADMLYSPFWALEGWMRFIEKIGEFVGGEGGRRAGVSQFTVQIAYEGADIRVSLHCLDPSSGFKDVIQQHKPRSIILTSGTLSPLKVWPLELGVNFAQPVSCPHVLSPQQVNTVILSVGPSGQTLETKFQNRKNPKLYEDIGQILYQIVKYTPNGVVALFPSSAFLEATKAHLSTQQTLTRIFECKNTYFERKDTSDFTTTLQRYMKEAQTDKGALLFALVRGKVSEGLDFAHKKCRAVVLVGVPYPCYKDVKVEAKMSYLDAVAKAGEKTLTGNQWYSSQTVRAINQGIGRLIRTPDDFGTVYLLDSRFNKPDIEGQLASWARLSLHKPATYQQFVKKVHEINKVKHRADIVAIQTEMGLTSLNGLSLAPQALLPPRTIRGSISRTPAPKTPEQREQERVKGTTLRELVETMKSEKEAKAATEEVRKQEQANVEDLIAKEERCKLDYQRSIFMRKTVKPLSPAKEICPVCQVEALMVKSKICHHSLCQECWDKWLKQDLRCPMCRGRVRKNFLVPEDIWGDEGQSN